MTPRATGQPAATPCVDASSECALGERPKGQGTIDAMGAGTIEASIGSGDRRRFRRASDGSVVSFYAIDGWSGRKIN
jgi:hypothetical protein